VTWCVWVLIFLNQVLGSSDNKSMTTLKLIFLWVNWKPRMRDLIDPVVSMHPQFVRSDVDHLVWPWFEYLACLHGVHSR
jgi:hypothetical protein